MKRTDDWMPDSALNVRTWAKEFTENAPAKLLAIGWTQPRIDALLALVSKLHNAAAAAVEAQQTLDTVQATLKDVRAEVLPALRENAHRIKATPGADDGLATLLGIASTTTSVDKASYQPTLDATSVAHGVQIMGKKRGATSLNIYARVRGQGPFKLIATKRVHFPFLDDAPSATPGQSELREYQAIGVEGDDEFGVPSDIVAATFNP